MSADILYNLNIKQIDAVFNIFTDKNSAAKRDYRPRWAIILKYEGETVYKNNGNTYVSNSENMILLPKGAKYEWKCTKAGRFYTIEFDCDEECSEIFSLPIDNWEKIYKVYKDAEAVQTLKSPTYKLSLLKFTYSILVSALQSKPAKYAPPLKRQKISAAVDYMINNYNKPMKNEELATLCGLSTIYFRKIFTETFGVSPIAYLHKLRIKKAKEILKSDHESISDIAYSLGYADIYDFSRAFKKRVGMSPTEYANNESNKS